MNNTAVINNLQSIDHYAKEILALNNLVPIIHKSGINKTIASVIAEYIPTFLDGSHELSTFTNDYSNINAIYAIEIIHKYIEKAVLMINDGTDEIRGLLPDEDNIEDD